MLGEALGPQSSGTTLSSPVYLSLPPLYGEPFKTAPTPYFGGRREKSSDLNRVSKKFTSV
jgi:hypothetical protein